MEKRYANFIVFIAVPVLIFALGILCTHAYLRGAITNYAHNSSKENIGRHLNQASAEVLVINIRNHNRRTLIISRIDISNGVIDVSGDQGLPSNEAQLAAATPAQIMRTAPIGSFVAEINLIATDILYPAVLEGGSEYGLYGANREISYYRLRASVRNASNTIAPSVENITNRFVVSSGEIITFIYHYQTSHLSDKFDKRY